MAAQKHGQHSHYIHPDMMPLSTHDYSSSSIMSHDSAAANQSTDNIISMDCSDHYDVTACSRNTVLTLLNALTGLVCVIHLFRLHRTRQAALHQFTLFYSALLQTIISSVFVMLGKYDGLEYTVEWLKLLQIIVLIHLYCTVVSQMHSKGSIVKRFVSPVCFVLLCGISLVVLGGCYFAWTARGMQLLSWTVLSSIELTCTQLFLTAAIFITIRLNDISTLSSVRRQQKRDLWLLVTIFELSAIYSFVCNLTLLISMYDEDFGYDGLFHHSQRLYTLIYGSYIFIRFILPIWGMLFTFRTIDSPNQREDLLPPNNDGCGSIFRPAHRRTHYKPISYAAGEFNATTPELQNSPGFTSSAGTTPIFGPRGHNGRRVSELQLSSDLDSSIEISDRQLML